MATLASEHHTTQQNESNLNENPQCFSLLTPFSFSAQIHRSIARVN